MNRVLNIVIISLLTLVYSVTQVGIGLHHCYSSDSTFVFLMSQDSSCSNIHPEDHCNCSDCACEDCQTKLFTLSIDQLPIYDEEVALNAPFVEIEILNNESDLLASVTSQEFIEFSESRQGVKEILSNFSIWRL